MQIFKIIDAILDHINLKYIREEQNTIFFHQIGDQKIFCVELNGRSLNESQLGYIH